LLRLASWFS
ncbi:hypothetical protein VCHC02C1_0919B, partial [Vibrio cholerae HC-02C1]